MTDGILQSGKIKYKQLYEWVINKINDGTFQYNDRLPSEAALCDQFQVSRQTVRNATDQLCKEGYIERVKGSGSFVKKKVRPRDKTIGVLFITVGDYINSNILDGMGDYLNGKGYSILLDISNNRVSSETRFLERMLDSKISGLIVEGTKSSLPTPNEPLFRKLSEQNVPYIFVNSYYDNVSAPAVVWDDRQGGYILTERLIHSGHKNIAGLFKGDEMQGLKRYLGYAQALMDHGIEVREDLIGWYHTSNQPQETKRQDLLVDLFTDDIAASGDALICYNDLIACRVIRRLMDAGISIPQQISVASFDNSDVTKFYGLGGIPSLNHPKEELGRQAAELLMRYIENPELDATACDIVRLPATI